MGGELLNPTLGLLEAVGLTAAITAADAMVKAADVQMVNMERAKGQGWITIMVTGDVAAVQAAIATGQALLQQMDRYVASQVISRTAEGLMDVVGQSKDPAFTPKQEDIQVKEAVEEIVKVITPPAESVEVVALEMEGVEEETPPAVKQPAKKTSSKRKKK